MIWGPGCTEEQPCHPNIEALRNISLTVIPVRRIFGRHPNLSRKVPPFLFVQTADRKLNAKASVLCAF